MILGGFRSFHVLVLMPVRHLSCLSALDCSLAFFFCCLFQAFYLSIPGSCHLSATHFSSPGMA